MSAGVCRQRQRAGRSATIKELTLHTLAIAVPVLNELVRGTALQYSVIPTYCKT